MNASLRRFALRFDRPLTSGPHASLRQVLFLQVETPDGLAVGEIAPLAGLHQEDLETAEHIAQRSLPWLVASLREECDWRALSALPAFQALPPSVKNGFEMCAFHAQALREPAPLKSWMRPPPQFPVRLNGLVAAPLQELEQALTTAPHFPAYKIKVGRLSSDEDIARVRLVRERFPEAELRLDANRAWTWSEALRVLAEVADCHIAYCEEPLQDSERLAELASRVSVPLALDETLQCTPERWDSLKHAVRAIVLKPAALGGWAAARHWIQAARAAQVTPVLSSCFESGWGLLWIALIAACEVEESPAVGLDTGNWIVRDALQPAFREYVTGAELALPERWEFQSVAEDKAGARC